MIRKLGRKGTMSLRRAWAFLTRLPGGAHPRDDRELGRSVGWFPAVGAVVGALSGAVYWALTARWGRRWPR